MKMKPQEYIKNSIQEALAKIGYVADDPKLLVLERPKQEEFGDISSPIAMSLARILKEAPRRIAEKIVANLEADPFYVEKVDIAGPGFINFYLGLGCMQQAVVDIHEEKEGYGQSNWGQGRRVQFEFVSANPTGPLNVVSARAAAVGDVLSNLFSRVGYSVHREYYVNDAGRQIRLLGASLSARYMTELGYEEPVPEDGYHGEYLVEMAKDLTAKEGDKYASLSPPERQQVFSQLALNRILRQQKKSLEEYRLQFDNWFHESVLREKNAQDEILNKFARAGLSYEKDGAVWFKSSQFGDEKDRVLVTSEGEPTYFLIDIAYHQTKYDRGFEMIYDLWGPDHHGYIDRMRAAMIALGHPAESFNVIIIQQVNLLRGGQPVKMSKRAGKIIEMDELLREVGVDAARYFFVDRRISQPLDFDIDLAKKQSDENPVYYVQYAHARICNIFRFAEERGVQYNGMINTSPLKDVHELALIKKLIDFPDIIFRAALFLEPHRLTNYLHEVATVFHRFYHGNRVVTEDEALTQARLTLADATRIVLANGLNILGISAPEYM